MEIALRYLSGGTVHRTPLIKNESAVNAMDSPWDDGGLASPRRGEAKRIGELYPFKIYSFFFFFPVKKHTHNLGVVRIDSKFGNV